MTINQLHAMQDYTFISRYAQYLKPQKRREIFPEAVDRYRRMMKTYYAGKNIDHIIDEACEAYDDQLVVASQRALQFAGPAILKKHERMYNCWGSYCDRPKFFGEYLFILLCGGGCGFSVQKHHVAKLPAIEDPKGESVVYTVKDSVEGWGDALMVLLSSYFVENQVFPEYFGKHVVFDYSEIRPEGAEFSHGVGRAPGPKGLANALDKIRKLLDNVCRTGRTKMRPIHAYDICMHASDAVLSGGIRRSATWVGFSLDDEEMMMAKTGDWYIKNPQRARSNNSVMLLRKKTSFEDFEKIIKYTKEFGEPAFVWVWSLEQVFNPCLEVGFWCYDEFGNSGWQCCNLSTKNARKIKNRKDWEKASRVASIMGTLQAGFTDFPYLGEVTERIVRREALLGVSLAGWMENPDLFLNTDLQREMAKIVKDTNREIAALIGINPAARSTCNKPDGNSAAMLGTASGVHGHKFRMGIRHIQANKQEAPLQFYKKHNPRSVEESVWSTNHTDEVISFAYEISPKSIIEGQYSAVEFLQIVKDIQINWVIEGANRELCVQPFLDNNVSNTCIVGEAEWQDVTKFIFDGQEYFTGVSLLSRSGDKDYAQAPFTTVHTEEEIVKEYGAGCLFASGLIEDATLAFPTLWSACDSALGIGEDLQRKPINDPDSAYLSLKIQWVQRVKEFSKKYMDNNVRKTTYLLKDVYNRKKYLDLLRETKKVDWSQLVEEVNETKGTQEIACAGGNCLI